MFCEDRDAVRKMTESMQRNYEGIREEREAEIKRSKEEGAGKKINSDEEGEEDHTLSECDECQEALRLINFTEHPKLKKYLDKY